MSRPPSAAGGHRVNVEDCHHLIKSKVIGLPGGFTKSGHPLLIFSDVPAFPKVEDSDLLLLLKYYISVIPRNEQSTGFAIVIDRRNSCWDEIQTVFAKIVAIFPAKMKEVFLLYQYPSGKPVLGQLVNDYLLDFDIFHVSHVTELMHYIDTKHLPVELGGMLNNDIETWLTVQQHVDSFTYSATKIARRLATFVKILNQEDISLHQHQDTMQEVAEKNRNCYKRLRRELEDLTDQGVYMMRQFQESGANLMQRLSVQMLCYQLDNTWQYFTRTFKMQDHLYVQYVELNQFQNQYRELTNKFNENEKIIKKMAISGESLDEVTRALDELDHVIEALGVDVIKAKCLVKSGQDLILDHAFARDCLG
ncbi:guanine nucleotide exchange factor DBS [Eurytemora carolleeae]|uniref:guanine nucleotide exchange factor DBS n=1 Tax=Eurytemora carolleeae TaxID=1294199 RepID=UPI000C76C662|nr:guanine nucleotide exchange factor DBS [Eurytemora carolleeae]|eukprot:XP_023327387.1 guanine nucleotide exchange factor DBS-like [Eurytemora affinis]